MSNADQDTSLFHYCGGAASTTEDKEGPERLEGSRPEACEGNLKEGSTQDKDQKTKNMNS